MPKQLLVRVYFAPLHYQQVSLVRDRATQKKKLCCTCGSVLQDFNRTMAIPDNQRACSHIRHLFYGSGISHPRREARALDPALEPTQHGRELFAWRWVERAIVMAP